MFTLEKEGPSSSLGSGSQMQALEGTHPCSPLAMPSHFLSGEHGPAESQRLSGTSEQVAEQQFCKADPGPVRPGCFGLWGSQLPTEEESPAGLSEPHLWATLDPFLASPDGDPDVSPGPDLPRGQGEAGREGAMPSFKGHPCFWGQKFKYTVGVFGLGGPIRGLGSCGCGRVCGWSCLRKVG